MARKHSLDDIEITRLIRRVAHERKGVSAGVRWIIDRCAMLRPHPDWKKLRGLDYEKDLAGIRSWFERSLEREPPRPGIRGWWFGLFTEAEPRGPATRMYVAWHSGPIDPKGKWASEVAPAFRDEVVRSKVLE